MIMPMPLPNQASDVVNIDSVGESDESAVHCLLAIARRMKWILILYIHFICYYVIYYVIYIVICLYVILDFELIHIICLWVS